MTESVRRAESIAPRAGEAESTPRIAISAERPVQPWHATHPRASRPVPGHGVAPAGAGPGAAAHRRLGAAALRLAAAALPRPHGAGADRTPRLPPPVAAPARQATRRSRDDQPPRAAQAAPFV